MPKKANDRVKFTPFTKKITFFHFLLGVSYKMPYSAFIMKTLLFIIFSLFCSEVFAIPCENAWDTYPKDHPKNLRGRDLSYANLQERHFLRVDFTGANMKGVFLIGSKLHRANLEEAILEEARMSSAIFERANLYKANLKNADLWRTVFYKANLEEANLQGARLYRTDFTQANLKKADLRGVKLHETVLRHTDLTEAILEGLNLYNADLTGAKLDGAKLDGAKVTKKQAEYLRKQGLSGFVVVE